MSRYAGHNLPGPRRGPRWSHLQQAPSVSFDRSSAESPSSPGSASAHSTAGEDKRRNSERCCTISINDGFSKDEALLNLDRFDGHVVPGMLVALVPLRGDSKMANATDGYGSANKQAVENLESSGIEASSSRDHENDLRHAFIFVAKDMPKETKARYPDVDVHVARHVADAFGLKKGSQAFLRPLDKAHPAVAATHVEISFKDQYLSRADMWRLVTGEMTQRTVYKGQFIFFLGTIKAQVTAVYVNGQTVQSAFFGKDTRPIFRSESARYVLFIQMAREMWDFDPEASGEITFDKVVNGFLPALFKRWAALKVKHLVSIVMFSRVEYDTGISADIVNSSSLNEYYTGLQQSGNRRPYKDFYRVVVSEMASDEWTTILNQLKKEFNYFRRDISMHHQTANGLKHADSEGENGKDGASHPIKAESSLSVHGNVLEAINMAASRFSYDHIDRDLTRTGISIVVLTPGPGIFEVDYETLRRTTESLVGNGIGIDLVCMANMPLHSAPLFKYRNPQYSDEGRSGQATALSRSFQSRGSTPNQRTPVLGSIPSLSGSFSPVKAPNSAGRLQTLALTGASEMYCYALPQWLHISYWSGKSAESLSYAGIALSVSNNAEQEDEDWFKVRCRMYDLQMRSILDANEIETAPLQTDPNYPAFSIQASAILKRRAAEFGEFVFIPSKHAPTALFDHVYGHRKFASDKLARTGEKLLWKQLQDYDNAKAKLTKGRHHQLHRPLSRNKVDLDDAARRHQIDDGSGASFPERKATTHLQSSIKFSMSSADIEKPDPSTPTSTATPAPSIAPASAFASASASAFAPSPTPAPAPEPAPQPSLQPAPEAAQAEPRLRKASLMKMPSFMRQISLGQRGFGVAAPKVAAVEAKAEAINAAAVLSSPKVKPPSKSNLLSGPRLLTPQTLTSRSSSLSLRSRKKSEASDTTLDGTLATPSIPISRDGLSGSSPAASELKTASPSMSTSYREARRGNLPEDKDVRFSNVLRAEDAQRVYTKKLRAGVVPELPTTLSPTTAITPWLTLLNPSRPESYKIDDTLLYSRWQHVFPRTSDMKIQKWKTLCCPAAVPLTTEYFPSKAQFDTEYLRHPYNVDQNVDDDILDEPKARKAFMKELISMRFSQGFQVVIGPLVARAFGQKIIKMDDIFSRDQTLDEGTSVFMSVGNTIHQLSCSKGTEVEVTIHRRKPTDSTPESRNFPSTYRPAIRTVMGSEYENRSIDILTPRPERNWNTIDSYLAGHYDEMQDSLGFWRARFVLVPLSARHPSIPRLHTGDNQEELRIEGIKKLAQLWQRNQYVPPSDSVYQAAIKRRSVIDIVYKTEDPSVVIAAELESLPILESLDGIQWKKQLVTRKEQFRKTHLNLGALADAMQQPVENGGVPLRNRRWHLRMHTSAFIGSDMTTWLLDNFEDLNSREEAEELGNILMVPNDPRDKNKGKGKDKDKNREKEEEKDESKDQERDKAKEKDKDKEKDDGEGKETAKDNEREKDGPEAKPDKAKGLFIHVQKRHNFRDGNYFYQIAPEFAKSRPGWFGGGGRRDIPSPVPPVSDDSCDSPRLGMPRPLAKDLTKSPASFGFSSASGQVPKNRPRVMLSKLIRYDIDPRKRSQRPERIDLHYDRLHNPDNCYQIRLGWMTATSKLVEDALESWEREVSQYGLRLVEVPIHEACRIMNTNPFRKPSVIQLSVRPPEERPETYYDPNSSKNFYQIAILKSFDFVLDMEAADNFPADVDVSYSWGKPDFKYTQYMHRSGTLLAQVNDDGDFLLVANRLYNQRSHMARDKEIRNHLVFSDPSSTLPSNGRVNTHLSSSYAADNASDAHIPAPSPQVRPTSYFSPISRASDAPASTAARALYYADPDVLQNDFEDFCRNESALTAFYKDVLERGPQRPFGTPASTATTLSIGGMEPIPEASIPSLGLPPGVLGDRYSGADGQNVAAGASMRVNKPTAFLRRGSVQYDGLGGGSKGK
ncbi:hypothetical protein E4U37_000097 [Claviceps purpurea]|nr:hypothetical protein E4U37_000097 [Claviceps purpurea]